MRRRLSVRCLASLALLVAPIGCASDDADSGAEEGSGTDTDLPPAVSGSGDSAASSSGSDTGTGSPDTEGDSGETEGDTGEPPPPPPPPPTDVGFAEGITIQKVEINQAVAIVTAECPDEPAGANCRAQAIGASEYNSPLVKNRHALVRAYWETTPGWTSHEIEGRLQLEHSDGEIEVLTERKTINGPSNASTLAGTFSWKVEPAQMTPGVKYSVSLHELDEESETPETERPRMPDEGTVDMGVPDEDVRIKVVIIPLTYGGTDPDLSEEVLEALHDLYYKWNPVEVDGVDLTVGTSTQISSPSSSAGLDAVDLLRSSHAPDPWVYYEGVADTSVFGGGIAWVTGPENNNWTNAHRNGASGISNGRWGPRVSVVLHENGHNQGMGHAPCNVSGDPGYPHAGGRIGVQGYDVLDEELLAGSENNDYMGYCGDQWVSDYHYNMAHHNLSTLTSWWNGEGPTGGDFEEGFDPSLVLTGFISPDGDTHWSLRPGPEYAGQDAEAPEGPVQHTVTFVSNEGSSYVREPTLGWAYSQELTRVVSVRAPADFLSLQDVDAIEVFVDGKDYTVSPHDLERSETRNVGRPD